MRPVVLFYLFYACVFVVGCERQNSTPSLAEFLGDKSRILDLTHSLSNESNFWPSANGNPFKYDTIFSQPSGAPGMGIYHTPEHFGTHIDAPIHSADHQPSVDELTAEELFGPAVIIDVSVKCAENADYEMNVDDVLTWEKDNGPMPSGAVVIMYTGWSQKWDDYDAYKNQDEEGQMHFPGFSVEVSQFLVNERDIIGIGIDNFSIDPAVVDGFPAHGIVNGAGKYHLENVANVHLLPEIGAYLIVAPIKIKGGSGGQVRLFAVLENVKS